MDDRSKDAKADLQTMQSVAEGRKYLTFAEKMTKNVEVGCKVVALIIILITFTWHIARLQIEGSDTCSMLFKNGRWVKKNWQPNGCMMHDYMPSETRTCLKFKKVAFVGDSRMRGLFYHLAGSLSGKKLGADKAHSNLQYTEPGNISVRFIWQPHASTKMNSVFKSWIKEPRAIPDLIVAGAGVWTIKEESVKAVLGYQENLKQLRKTLSTISSIITNRTLIDESLHMSRIFQRIKTRQQKHYVQKQWLKVVPQVIWMLQDPVVERKLRRDRKPITNEKIELFNLAAVKVLKESSIMILNASTEASGSKPEETTDGLHYSDKIIKVQLGMILNSFCNQYMIPNDASCCMEIEKITKLQHNTFAVFATCIILWLFMFCLRKCSKVREDEGVEQTGLAWLYSDVMYSVLKAMAKLGVIMAYFFVCDRCFILMKAHKDFSWLSFFVPIAVALLLGIGTMKKTAETRVLNCDQIDEWKGWMMFTILVYNYTGAEKILPIYLFIKVLFASYLFIIGFDNFLYLWSTGDYGLYRVCKIMARLNVIPVTACLVMDRPYQFYYLPPILSIWFIFFYLMMIFPPRLTEKYIDENIKNSLWVMVKFGVLFALIFIIWGNETVCDWLFSRVAIKELFIDTYDSVHQWTVTSGRNRYTVLYAMLAAFGYATAKKFGILSEEAGNIFLFKSKQTVFAAFFSVVGATLFGVHLFVCNDISVCNTAHAIASCIPITSYILLRNLPTYLRVRFSSFFSWIGSMSVELFIAQYHIWLAADAHGVLVFVPNYQTINALLTTFVFVCVVLELHKTSVTLSNALVTKDVRIMLRRLVIFILMLIVIWWHKTHAKKPLPS